MDYKKFFGCNIYGNLTLDLNKDISNLYTDKLVMFEMSDIHWKE